MLPARRSLFVLPIFLGTLAVPGLAQTFYGPQPYLSPADSPFPVLNGNFALETFEDHLANSPGLSIVAGFVTSTHYSSSIIDSVDSDDGVLANNACSSCDSYFFSGPSLVFNLKASDIGGLPQRVGVVWTDGGPNATVTFEAFDGSGLSLGTVVATGKGDSTFGGTTVDDDFYGAFYAGGISKFRIGSNGSMEIDHVQYDLPCPVAQAAIYCSAKTNTLGCKPEIGFLGCPSLSSAFACNVVGSMFLNKKNGILLYGLHETSLPFQGGTLCVQPPFKRVTLPNSGGSASGNDCTGTYAFDFNALAQSGSDANLAAGTEVFLQIWSRDPADSFGSSLSNALRFTIGN